jgi:predicted ArsR family transcriptional regulator
MKSDSTMDLLPPPVLQREAPNENKTDWAYRELKDRLWRDRIRNERDLTVQHLAERMEVSRNTITRALDRLVEDGMVLHEPQRGYMPVTPSSDQIEAAFASGFEQIQTVYFPSDRGSRRPSRRDSLRAEKLARAELVTRPADAEFVATSLEMLLREAIHRAEDRAHVDQFERSLTRLARIRRVEHLVVSNHFQEVAQLMRYFYACRYAKFVQLLWTYSARRMDMAAALEKELRALSDV